MTSVDRLNQVSKKELRQLIKNHFSMRHIFRSLTISQNTSTIHLFNKLVIEFNLEKKYKNKNNNPDIIRNIFEKIDTKEKAYWLGFIAADGHVPKHANRLSFTMSTKDEKHFDGFLNFINANINSKRYYTGIYNNKMFQISISNKVFIDNIKKWGIISPKSKNLTFPNLKNKKMQDFFLLGLFDGDGSEGGELSSGSLLLLQQIKAIFKIDKKIKNYKNKFGSCYSLTIPMQIRRRLTKDNLSFNLKRKQPQDKLVMINKLKKVKSWNIEVKHLSICECGNNMLITSKKCKDCHCKTNAYTKEDLETLIKKHSSLKLAGKELGISSNALTKQLKKYQINYKKYLKIQFGYESVNLDKVISYYKKTQSLKETSINFGIGVYKIKQIVKNTPTYKNMQTKKLKIKELKAKIIEMKKTHTFSEIAIKLDKSIVYIKGLYYTKTKKNPDLSLDF